MRISFFSDVSPDFFKQNSDQQPGSRRNAVNQTGKKKRCTSPISYPDQTTTKQHLIPIKKRTNVFHDLRLVLPTKTTANQSDGWFRGLKMKKTVSRSVLSLPRSLTLYIFIYLVYSNLHWYIYIYKFTQVTNPNSVFVAMSLCRKRFVYSQNTKCKTVKPYMFHTFQLPSFVGWIPPAPWFECLGIKNTCYIHLKSNTATHRNE